MNAGSPSAGSDKSTMGPQSSIGCGLVMTTVHLIRDYENRHGKMYCGVEGERAVYKAEFIDFFTSSGRIMLATTAMCEVTCERCQNGDAKVSEGEAGVRFVVIDFETYFGDDFTLSKMSTEAYIRDPRFKAHGAAIKWSKSVPAKWYDEPQLRYVLSQEDWSDVFLICHHAAFDGLILSHHYGVVPKMYGCTMSMARLLDPIHLSVSLDQYVSVLDCSPNAHRTLSSVENTGTSSTIKPVKLSPKAAKTKSSRSGKSSASSPKTSPPRSTKSSTASSECSWTPLFGLMPRPPRRSLGKRSECKSEQVHSLGHH